MEHNVRERILVSGCPGEENGWNTQLLYFTCSSLSRDDRNLFLITDQGGSPNVMARDLVTGEERILTRNSAGIMKSYVYFDCTPGKGLSKASVCLDPDRNTVYYIRDNVICRTGLDGQEKQLAKVPEDRVTAFTHVSADGKLLCVPMTSGRALDYDPETEGSGLDRRPVYDIDGRVQEEDLSSWLCVYDTETGELVFEKEVPRCWITHVQFNPADPEIIMYNHEWPSFDCGIRRIWIYDHRRDEIRRVRTEGTDTLGDPAGYPRKRGDWVCHEMWSDDGKIVIYHGGYENGPAMVGRYELASGRYWEIALLGDRAARRIRCLRAFHHGSRHEPGVRRVFPVPGGYKDRAGEQHGQRARSPQEGRRIYQPRHPGLECRKAALDPPVQAPERLAGPGRPSPRDLFPCGRQDLL